MSDIEVLDAAVWWGDGYENDPDLTFLLDRMPSWGVYDKRPVEGAPSWHVYLAREGDFITFFTWGGKADAGFGGARRTIELTDDTTEEVVGGWHTDGRVAEAVGHPAMLDVAIRTDYFRGRDGQRKLVGGIAAFMTYDRFRLEVERLLPDCEVIEAKYVGLTVKWRGQPSKREFMAAEHKRRSEIRERLKAKYHDGSWHGGDWYRKMTQAERDELACKPYGALGPAREAVA